jgi:ABC-type transport system substrate-binding protein
MLASATTASAAAFLAACGSDDDDDSGSTGSAGTATPGGASSASGSSGTTGSSSTGGSSGSTGGTSGLLTSIVDDTSSLKRGGTYMSALNATPTFDPHLTGNHVTHMWLNYSQLLKVKPGHMARSDGSVEGEIAESWEMSPDNLTITMKLTDKAHFPTTAPMNGRAVTMDDVIFSWQRYLGISPRAGELAAQVNPAGPIDSVTATDEKTLVIKLTRPVATILSSLTGGIPGTFYIVPKEAESQVDLKGTLAGSGPWSLEEWVPSSRITFKKNPGFGQDSRNVPYMDGLQFADLNEYATILAQFRTGEMYDTYNNFLPEDILQIKSDVPEMEIHSPDITTANGRGFFGQNDDSLFKDERLRQAMMYTWDRDLFIEVLYNTKSLEDAGLPIETLYDNALRDGSRLEGWFLDPRGSDFGENAKYFKYNPDEAKALQEAAGQSAPVAYDVFFGTLARHPTIFGNIVNILIGMARDSGIWTPNQQELNYDTDWNTKFRNNRGAFSGMAFIYDTGEADPANDLYSHYHSGASRYFGGDEKMDGMLDSMLQEFDIDARKQLAYDVQRYEGGKFWGPRIGGASGFRITWPALRNKHVWQDENQGRYLATNWLDQTKPPFV